MSAISVEEPAAVGAQHLDGLLRSHRALRNGLHLRRLFERMRGGVGVQILRHALADQQERIDERGRDKDVQEDARGVDPEVNDGGRCGPLDAANQGNGDRDACRGREKVVRGEARHLGEIAHGGLGCIELPVRVRGEADRRIPGQIGADVGQALRVPGQVRLQTLDSVRDHQAHRGEAQHGKGVLAPVHLLRRIHAGKLVDQALNGPKKRVQPGAFAFEDTGHVGADGTNGCKQDQRVEGKLQPAVGGHVRTSPGRVA